MKQNYSMIYNVTFIFSLNKNCHSHQQKSSDPQFLRKIQLPEGTPLHQKRALNHRESLKVRPLRSSGLQYQPGETTRVLSFEFSTENIT